ncbi:MAG: GNAT family N-acetyltransferase [Cyanobacteria bacterium P01_A01_bin.45]
MSFEFYIREATSSEDIIIAKQFYQMWLDIGIEEDNIQDDWQFITLDFIKLARENLYYKGFFAEVDGVIVGSVSCQLMFGLYPNVLKKKARKDGYIWGVYVEKSYRRKGIAKQLMDTAVGYLKTIDCSRAVLNASPEGKSVYERMGFVVSNGMHLNLL